MAFFIIFAYVNLLDAYIPTPITSHLLGGREVFVKREDLIHPLISGNKFRKLKYVLEDLLSRGIREVVSFGGAYSNHIHALSYACRINDLKLRLFIRGEPILNSTLSFVKEQGAELCFVSREKYRILKDTSSFPEWPHAVVIPEGGSSKLALLGIREMMEEIDVPAVQYCVSYGSGATSIGMLAALSADAHLHVFSALKFPSFPSVFNEKCSELGVSGSEGEVHLHDGYHFGGYAKWNPDLIDFIKSFEIPLDPVYTGKMFFGIRDLIRKGVLKEDRPIVAIHTGGLQGREGFNSRFGNLLMD